MVIKPFVSFAAHLSFRCIRRSIDPWNFTPAGLRPLLSSSQEDNNAFARPFDDKRVRRRLLRQ